ncbi:MAG TPA: hypothetical protein VGS80_16190 [Ktedonobacterales bacterium]|nr:hypothetical protein [Ktedonobacterales bacterium]
MSVDGGRVAHELRTGAAGDEERIPFASSPTDSGVDPGGVHAGVGSALFFDARKMATTLRVT